MAPGLILQVSWICFLLFGSSVGLPAIKGYGYPSMTDSRNMGNDDDDEVLTSLNWQASNNQPTGPVYASYNEPSVAEQPAWAPSPQNLPNNPSGPEERLTNAVPRDWGLENHDAPLLFPLQSNPAKPQPGPVQPQSSLGVPSMNSATASQSAHVSPTTYNGPSFPSQGGKSPSSVSWQPVPVSSGHGEVDFNADPSTDGGSLPHLVYENVFQYPPENSEPSNPGTDSNVAGGYGHPNYMSEGSSTGHATTLGFRPSVPSHTGSQPGHSPGGMNFNSGQTNYQPRHEKISWRPQKTVNTPRVEVSQRVSEPMPPPPPPPPASTYIVQSSSGYQRGMHLLSKSSYSPVPPPMPVSTKGVMATAPAQPPAPKGAKNPQRANW